MLTTVVSPTVSTVLWKHFSKDIVEQCGEGNSDQARVITHQRTRVEIRNIPQFSCDAFDLCALGFGHAFHIPQCARNGHNTDLRTGCNVLYPHWFNYENPL